MERRGKAGPSPFPLAGHQCKRKRCWKLLGATVTGPDLWLGQRRWVRASQAPEHPGAETPVQLK